MRGAVSVALVYLYYDPDGTTVDAQKSSLISMTLTVVLFSTLVYGAITKPMLDFLLGAKPGAPRLDVKAPAHCSYPLLQNTLDTR